MTSGQGQSSVRYLANAPTASTEGDGSLQNAAVQQQAMRYLPSSGFLAYYTLQSG